MPKSKNDRIHSRVSGGAPHSRPVVSGSSGPILAAVESSVAPVSAVVLASSALGPSPRDSAPVVDLTSDAAPVVPKTKVKQQTAVQRYCFTYNNPTAHLEIPDCVQFLSYQLELAPTTGTPHYQGYVEFKKPVRVTGIKKLGVGWSTMWLKACDGDQASNLKYTTKDESKCSSGDSVYYGIPMLNNPGKSLSYCELIAAILADKFDASAPGNLLAEYLRHKRSVDDYLRAQLAMTAAKMPLEDIVLRPWQQDIINIVNGEVQPRKVHWFYDLQGKTGKSTFTKYLIKYHQAVAVSTTAAERVIRAFQSKWYPVVVMDISRDEGSKNAVNYSILETLKNGVAFNTMYEPGMVLFQKPHVIVFSNIHPDMSKLSADRWDIRNITPGQIGFPVVAFQPYVASFPDASVSAPVGMSSSVQSARVQPAPVPAPFVCLPGCSWDGPPVAHACNDSVWEHVHDAERSNHQQSIYDQEARDRATADEQAMAEALEPLLN